jgi:hypothetical protein
MFHEVIFRRDASDGGCDESDTQCIEALEEPAPALGPRRAADAILRSAALPEAARLDLPKVSSSVI